MTWLEHYWQSTNLVTLLLWPLSLLYETAMMLRRLAFRAGLLQGRHAGAPVIAVGTISLRGGGRTPFLIWLADVLRTAGYRPGIVIDGACAPAQNAACVVQADSDPRRVGDSALLLARHGGCPVLSDRDRVAAARALVHTHGCDVILVDDALQYYRLARELEIAVIDETRGLANGACLPAGPLREPRRRLRRVDFVIGYGSARSGQYLMTLVGERAVNLTDAKISCSLTTFANALVHTVAGISDPPRFFNHLRAHQLRVIEHPFPDHHFYTAADLDFGDELPVLMTEKDAVKCQAFAEERFWYVPARARIDPELERLLLARLQHLALTSTFSPDVR